MLQRRQILERAALILGGCLTSSTWAGMLEWVDEPRKPQRSVLTADQQQVMATLCELIIPATDTPGALAAGVPDFVDRMVSDWYFESERLTFLQGLVAAEQYSLETQGKPFLDSTPQVQKATLDAAMADAASYQPDPGALFSGDTDEASPFFFKLRELTLLGYYTSEVGCTQELRYNMMPGHYRGDVPLSEVGRSWAGGII